jgi:hypothetical protein
MSDMGNERFVVIQFRIDGGTHVEARGGYDAALELYRETRDKIGSDIQQMILAEVLQKTTVVAVPVPADGMLGRWGDDQG